MVKRRGGERTPLSTQCAALTERLLAVCHCYVKSQIGCHLQRRHERLCLRSGAVHRQPVGVQVFVAVNAKPTLGLWSVECPALTESGQSSLASKLSCLFS